MGEGLLWVCNPWVGVPGYTVGLQPMGKGSIFRYDHYN